MSVLCVWSITKSHVQHDHKSRCQPSPQILIFKRITQAFFYCSFFSPSGGLWWELHFSIRSDLLPWLPWQIRGWACLLLDYPGHWIFGHPLQFHLLWHLRPDRHGGAIGWLHKSSGGPLRLAKPSAGSGKHHGRLCHTVLLLWPNQPGQGICSSLPRWELTRFSEMSHLLWCFPSL